MSMAGLREHKKQLTRTAIIRESMRLFAEQGYDSTTVTQVSAAATVSPATFFTYFPTKEDVVFADHRARTEAVSQQLRTPRPDDSPRSLLRRALSPIFTIGLSDEWDEELHRRRGAVVFASASLRAAAVGRLFESAQVWADELNAAIPDLSPFDARTLIGGALGAGIAAAWHGMDTDQVGLLALAQQALDRSLT
jgi:AcrR family transcriptional regulator